MTTGESPSGVISDIAQFLRSVTNNWIATMGGVVSVAAWIAGYFTKTSDPNLSYKILWPAAASCILLAFFSVWRREHRLAINEHNARLKAEEESEPNLQGKIVGIFPTTVGQPPAKKLVIFAEIRNLGAPSIADDFQFRVEDVAEVIPFEIQGFAGKLTLKHLDWEMPIYQRDLLPAKSAEPIPRGGKVVGHVLVDISDPSLESLGRVHLKLSFRDVVGKVVVAGYDGGKVVEMKRPTYYPGMANPLTRNK